MIKIYIYIYIFIIKLKKGVVVRIVCDSVEMKMAVIQVPEYQRVPHKKSDTLFIFPINCLTNESTLTFLLILNSHTLPVYLQA